MYTYLHVYIHIYIYIYIYIFIYIHILYIYNIYIYTYIYIYIHTFTLIYIHTYMLILTEFFLFFGMRASWMHIIGGPCSKILYISLLPFWYPWGPTFHDTAFSTEFVEMEPVILRLTSQLSLCFFSVFAVFSSIQRFHPTRIGVRLACCLLAYAPVKPNMFSVSEPSSIMSFSQDCGSRSPGWS